MKLSFTLLLALLILLQYSLWFKHTGLLSIFNNEKKLEQINTQNELLKNQNNRLYEEVADLKSGHEAIEQHAREELGMIKQNEKFYQYVETK